MTTLETLQIGIIQTDLVWKSPRLNLDHIAQIIHESPLCNLYVLPELFPSAFCIDPQLAEPMNGTSVEWMKSLAHAKQAVIAGSVAIRENDKIFNRFLWVRPDASIEYYDKHYLFSLGKEALEFTAGSMRKIVHEWGWNFALQVCYDLRFPCWSMNTYTQAVYGYDVLLYVASWPEVRQNDWIHLLQARAIENQAYCVGVNRIGCDGDGYQYSGFSQAYNFQGELLYNGASREECGIITIHKKELDARRHNFLVAKDWNLKTD
ncbi:MAG: nitrilase-related carbon-nitrogen hydrolase [Bacteroidales bacterium]